jgi:hypothetical protein
MSSRIPFAAVQNVMHALVVIGLLSAVAHAADSHAPSDPNAPAKKAKAQAASVPPNNPKPPALRNPASFTPQTPFGEAIDILRNSTRPPLSIVVLWKQLGDGAGVYRDTPIGIDGVSGLRASQVLDLLMLSLSAGSSAKLGYAVEKGVITITTVDTLPAPKRVTRIYDIRDLVAPPALYSLPSMGLGLGYGGPAAPFGGYAGNLGAGSYGFNSGGSLPGSAGSTYRSTGQGPGVYRSR